MSLWGKRYGGGQLWALIVAVLWTLVQGFSPLVASPSLKPILPLDVSYQPYHLPEYVMQYHTAELPVFEDVADFRRAYDRYLSWGRASSTDVQRAFDRLYLGVAIKYYVDKAGAIGPGTIKDKTGLSQVEMRTLMSRITHDVRRDAQFLFKKSRQNRAIFQYYIHTIGSGGINDISLRGLRRILKDPEAVPALKQRVYFILFYYGVSDENTLQKISRVRSLQKLYYARASSLSIEASIASSLALASAYVGVKSGNRVRDRVYSEYMVHLKKAASRLNRVDEYLASRVVAEVLSLWTLAHRQQNRTPDYSKLPLALDTLKNTELYYPLLERQGISRYENMKRSPAATRAWQAMYRRMLLKESLLKYHPLFLKWLLDERYAQYQRSRRFAVFEREIHWQLGRVVPRVQENDGYRRHYQLLVKAYRSLVSGETQRVMQKKATAADKRAYLGLVDRYIQRIKPTQEDVALLYEHQARVYVSLKVYPMAVRLYLAAHKVTTHPPLQLRFLSQAVENQKLVARWPQKVPWQTPVKNVALVPAKMLLKLYDQKITLLQTMQQSANTTSYPWEDVAHKAHLHIHLRQPLAGADLLVQGVKSGVSHPYVPGAAWVVLQLYERAKSWSQLEQFAVYIRDAKIVPRLGSRTVDVKQKIALALYEGGKAYHMKRQYSLAVEKFKRYLSWFPSSTIEADVRHYLARSYWAGGQHLAGMHELRLIVKDMRSYPHYKRVVIQGIDWAHDIAVEEAVIFFVESYLRHFKDRRVYDLRRSMIDLYEGTERYKEAVGNYLALKSSSFVSQREKNEYDLRLLKVVDQYGSVPEALKYSRDAMKQSSDPRVLSLAHYIQGKYYFSKKDTKRLQDLERGMASLNQSVEEVRERRAMLRLMSLKLVDAHVLYREVQHISLSNPALYIQGTLRKLENYYGSFKAICSHGSSSVCNDAMNWFVNVLMKTKSSLSEIEVSTSVNEEVQKTFAQVKRASMVRIDRLSQSSYQLSMSSVMRKGSTPQSILDTLWLHNKDWNFDPLTWGQGSGFITWEMMGREREPI